MYRERYRLFKPATVDQMNIVLFPPYSRLRLLEALLILTIISIVRLESRISVIISDQYRFNSIFYSSFFSNLFPLFFVTLYQNKPTRRLQISMYLYMLKISSHEYHIVFTGLILHFQEEQQHHRNTKTMYRYMNSSCSLLKTVQFRIMKTYSIVALV